MKLSVVIPVYNEAKTIEIILARVLKTPELLEIIVVDDASTDGTGEALARISDSKVRVIRHPVNRGKGAALRSAFQQIRGEVVIIQDADLEYDPGEYPRLLRPIEMHLADVVFGSRFTGETHRVLYFWHYVGNRFLTTLSNMFTNLNLTDMETCYKAFRADALRGLILKSERFGIEPEITAKVARRGLRVYETSISYHGRNYSEGKKITWRDGLAAVGAIFRFGLFD